MADPFHIVTSGIDANMRRLATHSQNATNANQPGYTRKDREVVSNMTAGEVSGVIAKEAVRYVNDTMIKQIRFQQSDVSSLSTQEEYATRIQQLHGNKGNSSALSHKLEKITESMKTLASNITHPNTTQVIHQLDQFCKQMQNTDEKLQDMVYEIHTDHHRSVKAINQHLHNIKNAGQQIFQLSNTSQSTADLYDMVDRDIHEMSKHMNVSVTFSNETPPSITVTTKSGIMLLNQSSSVNELEYSSNVTLLPGSDLPRVTVGGRDITKDIDTGMMQAHRELVDTRIKNIREECDELSFHLRDQLNMLHNEGTPEELRPTLLGSIGVPGVPSMNGTTLISGQGTLRLGVMQRVNDERQLASYHDIPLTNNMTLNNLITTINSGSSGVQAALSADGRLQLHTPAPGTGVVLGSSGGPPKAELSAGASFDPSNKWGVSHFFGLNNLLETEHLLPGEKIHGIAGAIRVRPDLINQGRLLSFARLTDKPLGTLPHAHPIQKRDVSITQDMIKRMRSDLLDIPAAGHLPGAHTSLQDYARRIIDGTTNYPNDIKASLTQQRQVLEELSHKAHEVSGVDVRDEMLAIVRLGQNQQILFKTLQMVNQMMKDLSDTMKGI
jgi:flagellar hook-associated protein 1 FlgK